MWPDCCRDPEGVALLQVAVARPREQTPRLVLADWLQEHGEEEVAGVIRESMRTRSWIFFPDGPEGRWAPLNCAYDGWVGVHYKSGTLPKKSGSLLRAVFGLFSTSQSLLPTQRDSSSNLWLTAFDLASADVKNAVLRELAPLQNLTTLNLRGTKVTDAALKELVALKNITRLGLGGTKVTVAGVQELQKALPKCVVSK